MSNPFLIAFAALAGSLLFKKSTKISAKSKAEFPLEFDDSPEPEVSPGQPPMLGASSCFGSMYGGLSRTGNNTGLIALMNKGAKSVVLPPNGKYTWVDSKGIVHSFTPGLSYLSALGQIAAFKAALTMIDGPEKSTISIMTRNILKKLMPNCNWDIDVHPVFGHEAMPKTQYNLWVSVWYLVTAAARQKKYKIGGKNPIKNLLIPPDGGPGLLVGRRFLEMPEVVGGGSGGLGIDLELGRRVELIAGDYRKVELPTPPLLHAEPVYAYVVGSASGVPTVEILSNFQGKDVTPNFAHRHGFYPGKRVKLTSLWPGAKSYSTAATGIRRIFASGVE